MTSRKIAVTLLLVLPLAAAATSAMAAQTFISTTWVETKLSMNDCLERAAAAIRGAGGWGNVMNTSEARHALRSGLYTSQIRCIPDKEMAIIVVAGPTNTTEKYLTDLQNNF